MSKVNLEDLKSALNTQDSQIQDVLKAEKSTHAVEHVQKLDAFGRAYATGKRKSSVARVWLKPGTGKITINKKDYKDYFARFVLKQMVDQPFVVADRLGQYDVFATVKGGGLSGQAGAIRHGISCAMAFFDPTIRPPLKQQKLLTRDSRRVERKKYGRPKARRRFQFSKR